MTNERKEVLKRCGVYASLLGGCAAFWAAVVLGGVTLLRLW